MGHSGISVLRRSRHQDHISSAIAITTPSSGRWYPSVAGSQRRWVRCGP